MEENDREGGRGVRVLMHLVIFVPVGEEIPTFDYS